MHIKTDDPDEQEYFDYLEKLRQSGIVNMLGAAAYLAAEFDMDEKEAGVILFEWMDAHHAVKAEALMEEGDG